MRKLKFSYITPRPRHYKQDPLMDGTGWHKSQELILPENIEIIYLPPYSPELNPVETF